MTLKERQDEFIDVLADNVSMALEDRLVIPKISETDEYLQTALTLLKNDIFVGMADAFIDEWTWEGIEWTDYSLPIPIYKITFTLADGFKVEDTGGKDTVYFGDIVEEYFSPRERQLLFSGKKWVA